jgi:hypothetical protein
MKESNNTLFDHSPKSYRARTTDVEVQLNVWIPKHLMHKAKERKFETDESIKEITIKALSLYLNGGQLELEFRD